MASPPSSADNALSQDVPVSEDAPPEAASSDTQTASEEEVGSGIEPQLVEPDEAISNECSEASSALGDSETTSVRENGDAPTPQSELSVPSSPVPNSGIPEEKKGRKRFGFLDR